MLIVFTNHLWEKRGQFAILTIALPIQTLVSATIFWTSTRKQEGSHTKKWLKREFREDHRGIKQVLQSLQSFMPTTTKNTYISPTVTIWLTQNSPVWKSWHWKSLPGNLLEAYPVTIIIGG